MKKTILIIGAGLAGLSAALTTVEHDGKVILISTMPSERAQSVMAEGGINAALNTKDEGDSTEEHYKDTMRESAALADPNAVRGLVEAAPGIVRRLLEWGVLFNMDNNNDPNLRYFGGQKKRRTVFAQSSTGKQMVSALIQAVRKHEVAGSVQRYSHHSFSALIKNKAGACCGCVITDNHTRQALSIHGDAVIIATGGFHGLFGGTTGSLNNTGTVTAALFRSGVPIANGEFIQYHPTTVSCSGKHLLISEAARGEGARLFTYRNGRPWYFMEEKYPEWGNLAPRDMLSHEIWEVQKQSPVYLDMTTLSDAVLQNKLVDIVEDCMTYLKIDPRKEQIPVAPGIHYFMGGIQVDKRHQTIVPRLYASGECCCQYHGANRLGGNSLLGAIHGGMVAAASAMKAAPLEPAPEVALPPLVSTSGNLITRNALRRILNASLGIVRDKATLEAGLCRLEKMITGDNEPDDLCLLGKALLMSALSREESRGAHYRSDFPERKDSTFKKTTIAQYDGKNISVRFVPISEGC